MEPIIEEGDEIARVSAISTRLHERFTSEQIDTLVRYCQPPIEIAPPMLALIPALLSLCARVRACDWWW
jgi:hypothetical protein